MGWVSQGVAIAQENALRNHPVPYLALHGEDPIHWHEWGPEVMAKARQENRLVLLSIGYFSCHWCHVMQRESFHNPEIAGFANQYFIPVKVDREMNPALDHAMMSFAETILGRAGWPLNVFLTPDGAPVYALLYQPPEQFLQSLQRLHSLWSEKETELRRLVDNFPWQPDPKTLIPVEDADLQALLMRARQQILEQGDTFQGGFGSQSKFPSVPQVGFLLAAQAHLPDDEARHFLITTLDAMMQYGLRDHLSGGFYRYAVDPGWQIPHFEKMLYDNAMLAMLYLEAGQILDREDYLTVGKETLDFMHNYMWLDGALVSSLSAVDEHDVEGGAYLWHPSELRQLLTASEFAVADAVWGVSQPAEFEAGNHLRQFRNMAEAAAFLNLEVAETERLLARCREKLLTVRAARQVPVDQKLVSGWNGLALSAFARAVRYFPHGHYRHIAAELQTFLTERVMREGDAPDLARAEVAGTPRGRGSLEDYAYVSQGLHDWAVLTGNRTDYDRATEVARAGWAKHLSEAGWRRGPELVRTLPDVVPLMEDGPMPSPSAVLLKVSRALSEYQGDGEWSEEVRRVSRWGFGEVRESPYWYASQLALFLPDSSLESR